MRRTILFAASMMVWSLASSQIVSLADVKAKGAVQLSAADLEQLLPGAKVMNQNMGGATRRWENSLSGDVAASSDGRGGGGKPQPGSGSGTWKINDNGKYCVNIRWNGRGAIEDWCRYVFKAGDKYYAFGTLEDTVQGSEFEFTR
jgi:hypothetical protein